MTRPILVVDDHTDSCQMIEDLLAAAGFSTVAASNGVEALARLRERRPCLILLDLWMPLMSGPHFREEQRRLSDEELANVPVVMMSAVDHGDEARALGAVAFLLKPVDLDRLMELVRRHVAAADKGVVS